MIDLPMPFVVFAVVVAAAMVAFVIAFVREAIKDQEPPTRKRWCGCPMRSLGRFEAITHDCDFVTIGDTLFKRHICHIHHVYKYVRYSKANPQCPDFMGQESGQRHE